MFFFFGCFFFSLVIGPSSSLHKSSEVFRLFSVCSGARGFQGNGMAPWTDTEKWGEHPSVSSVCSCRDWLGGRGEERGGWGLLDKFLAAVAIRHADRFRGRKLRRGNPGRSSRNYIYWWGRGTDVNNTREALSVSAIFHIVCVGVGWKVQLHMKSVIAMKILSKI